MKRFHIRSALLLALLATLMLAVTGTLYAAGEQFPRAAVLSGGGSDASGGVTLQSALGAPVAGAVFSSSGANVCSGFLCAPALKPAACTPLTSVTINGPTVGTIGVAYNFTALSAPDTATGPVVYTWSPAPTSGQGTASAAITFNTSGVQNVTVSAANCSGAATANDGHDITIGSSSSGKPVTGVAIGGPTTGSPNTDYAFTATVSPSDADTPVTYTWSPEPKSGQGTPSAVYSFSSSGAKNISVTAQNAGGGNSDLHTITIGSSGTSSDKIFAPLLSR